MSIRQYLGASLWLLIGLSAIFCILAGVTCLDRHGVVFPILRSEILKDVQLEHGFAYIAPTHHPELSGQEGPSVGTVLENGIPLPGPADADHEEIRVKGAGRFSFWGDYVRFSSTDNSVPTHNGRSYEIRYPLVVSLSLAVVIYRCALFFVCATILVAVIDFETRQRGRAVIAALAGPLMLFFLGVAFMLCVLLGGAYLKRNGFLWFGWMGEMVRGIQPGLGFDQSYLARGMQVAGILLCLGALILGLFKLLGVELPEWLENTAGFSAWLLRNEYALILLCLSLLAGGLIWFRAHPFVRLLPGVEAIIVDEQIKRAKTIDEADVVVTGDSSALMDVDATRLGALLGGRRVENLSTLGFVGARGYAHLLELYCARGSRAKAVVLLMHGISLDRPEHAGWDTWEDMVVKEQILTETVDNPFEGLREELSSVLFARNLALPMASAWGRYYGTQFEVRDAIRDSHGSIFEPLSPLPAETGRWDSVSAPGKSGAGAALTYRLAPSEAIALQEFASVVAKLPIEHVYFGISPTRLSLKTEQAMSENEKVAQQVAGIMRRSLGSRFELLNIVPFRADEYFVTATHMNSMGREHFTRTLANILSPVSK